MARRPAHERFCMHRAVTARRRGIRARWRTQSQVEDTKHMVFRCSLYSGFRCSYPHLFASPPPREVPQYVLAQPAAGHPPHPPSQLALPLSFAPTPCAHAACPAEHEPVRPGVRWHRQTRGSGGRTCPARGGSHHPDCQPAMDSASFCGACRRLGQQRAGLPT